MLRIDTTGEVLLTADMNEFQQIQAKRKEHYKVRRTISTLLRSHGSSEVENLIEGMFEQKSEEMKKQETKYKQFNTELVKQLSNTKVDLHRAQEDNKQLRRQRKKHSRIRDSHSMTLAQYETDHQRIFKEMDRLRANAKQLELENNLVAVTNKRQKDELDRLSKENDSLKVSLQKGDEEINLLRSESQSAQAELATMRQKIPFNTHAQSSAQSSTQDRMSLCSNISGKDTTRMSENDTECDKLALDSIEGPNAKASQTAEPPIPRTPEKSNAPSKAAVTPPTLNATVTT